MTIGMILFLIWCFLGFSTLLSFFYFKQKQITVADIFMATLLCVIGVPIAIGMYGEDIVVFKKK